MKFQFLGTAAAEGFPALFCACPKCVRARELGGRNLRSRCQSLLDGKLLLDFGPDTLWHLTRERLDPCAVRACLITHTHEDHYTPHEFGWMRKGYSHPVPDYCFRVYGSEDILEPLEYFVRESGGKLVTKALRPFERVQILNYEVTPLPASHGTDHPYLYLISDGAKTLFYAHDTGIFPAPTWEYLQSSGVRVDLCSIDCNEGAEEEIGYGSHMCLGRVDRCVARLREDGVFTEKTVIVCNHFSHNGLDAVYEDFAPAAAARGYETSWDGMTVEV